MVSPPRLSENRQAAAAWVTSTLSPPTAIAVDRAEGTVLAATEYPIDASPCPDRAPLIVSQLASEETVQVQSRVVEIASVALPPVALKFVVDVLARTSHRASVAVGVVSEVSADVHAERVTVAVRIRRVRAHISSIRRT
jgi:hypothetical protein